jgi:tetratricopeptide (TPR) repeat protein
VSLGLSQITNDAEATIRFLVYFGKYFDKWFITVADKDKKQLKRLQEWYEQADELWPPAEFSYFKWTDDFAAARNFNLEQIDTDYWFWADSDDTIENPEHIQEVVKYMQANSLDVVYLRYDYTQDEAGNGIADHWRERFIRRAFEAKWDAPVHETLQSHAAAATERLDWIVVKHRKEALDVMGSHKRNKKILEKHWKETKDPRDASYLGSIYLAERRYDEAIQYFLKHIQTSGSPEDQYRSWCRIADTEWLQHHHEQALYATDEAIRIRPRFPDAYYIKVAIYTELEDFDKGIEWLQVAMSKPMPDTMAMIDPTLYQYRGMALGATCFLFSGRVKEAFKLYQAVKEVAPDFYAIKEDGVDWPKMYEDAYFDQKAVDYMKWLLHYVDGNAGKTSKLFEALPPRLYADPRLNAERVKFLPKQVWPKKSIAILCGQGLEPWGPDTLNKGMGGSEEAVVYLSRELAKLGWQVTVFNDREEEYVDGVVTYKPWTLLNPYDQFDVFVAWRAPESLKGIKARQKVADLHDTIQPERVYQVAKDEPKALFFVKSQYHRSLYPKLSDDRFVVIGNGIVKEHFS